MANRTTHRLAAAAMLAALTLPAFAQQAPAPGAAGARHHHHSSPAERAEHRAQRLAALKQELKLTPAQEPAWNAFTAALQPGERAARMDRGSMSTLTTPERIDRMREMRAQHAAEADRRGEATKAFYAALTPEQQKTFDERGHRGQRMGGMKGHGGQPGVRGG